MDSVLRSIKKNVNLGFVLLFVALTLVPILVTDNYLLQSFIIVLFYAYLASSWNIIGGFAGHMSMGHAAYVGIGAYVSTVLFMQFGVTPWFGMIAGGLVSATLGVIVGFPTFRLRGVYYTLSTMAFVNIIRLYFLANDTIFGLTTGGPLGIKVRWGGGSLIDMQFLDKRNYAFIIIGMLAVVMLVSAHIKKSRTGYYLAAITTNQHAAASLGVNTTYYKLKAQFLSCFFTAIGGAFYAQLILFIDPSRLMGFELSLEIAVIALVGGASTVFGPVLGAFILVPINEWCRIVLGTRMSGLAMVIYSLVLMCVVYYLNRGLLDGIKRLFPLVSKILRIQGGEKT